MERVIVTPLGGVGEIGINALVLEYKGEAVLIDFGQMFSSEPCYGIDAYLPDPQYLFEDAPKLLAIVATHGHEDHIGAIPYFFRELGVPVYGTDFTLALITSRLKEHNATPQGLLKRVSAGDKVQVGPFDIEFISVAHSIVGSLALAIKTPAGMVVHTSDFKTQGPTFDKERFAALGEEGVLLMLSDSTNVEVEGFTPSEAEVLPALEQIFEEATGKIVFTTFSSHIPRIQQVFELAERFGRKVAVAGRSMLNNLQTAVELGYLRLPVGLWVHESAVRSLKPQEVVALVTGSQGEFQAVLRAITNKAHRSIVIEEGDTVVFSSRIIPGNERQVYEVINGLYAQGANAFYGRDAKIHASGHGAREDQRLMLELVKPRYFMPIHGEIRHLKQHLELALETGIPKERLIYALDGERFAVSQEGAEQLGTVPTGRIPAVGKLLADIDPQTLKERRILSNEGIVVVLINLNDKTREVETLFELVSSGFLNGSSGDHLFKARKILEETVESLGPQAFKDPDALKESVRKKLKRFFQKTLNKRPLILPVVLNG